MTIATSDLATEHAPATLAGGVTASVMTARLSTYALGVVYCVFLGLVYRKLSEFWTYLGFSYDPPGYLFVPLALASAIPLLMLPQRPRSVSELAAWILSFTLFMPALLIPHLQGWVSVYDRWSLFTTLLVCSSAFNALARPPGWRLPPIRLSPALLWAFLIAIWVVMHGSVLFVFGKNLSVAAIDQVYEQRSAAAFAVRDNPVISYVLSNASSALNPVLIAVGLVTRRWHIAALGVLGQWIVYSALAGKIVIVFIVVVAGSLLLFDRQSHLRPHRFAWGLMGAVFVGWLFAWSYLPGAGFFNDLYDLVYLRTLCLPGMLVGAYWSFFSVYPVTYFSHAIVGRLFIEYPYGQLSIGQVIGDYVTPALGGNPNNYNASFIAADGITGLGLWGIPLTFFLVLLMLKVIDGVTGGVSLRIRCAALIPFIMWLSDGSLFTALVTGGGAMVIGLLWLAGSADPQVGKRASAAR